MLTITTSASYVPRSVATPDTHSSPQIDETRSPRCTCTPCCSSSCFAARANASSYRGKSWSAASMMRRLFTRCNKHASASSNPIAPPPMMATLQRRFSIASRIRSASCGVLSVNRFAFSAPGTGNCRAAAPLAISRRSYDSANAFPASVVPNTVFCVKSMRSTVCPVRMTMPFFSKSETERIRTKSISSLMPAI